jgi:hypothetical protein
VTQLSKILWFVFTAAVLVLLPGRAAAQVSVTPTVNPTPPGQLIVVNNGPGFNHTDPHVDGDLVCYNRPIKSVQCDGPVFQSHHSYR